MQSLSEHANGLEDGWVAFLIEALIVGIFIFVAARIVIDRGGILSAILGAILAALAMGLILQFVPGVLGLVLALAAGALILAVVFRTSWLKGAVIGLVAWVIGLLVDWLIGRF